MAVDDEVVVRIDDVRAARFCAPGIFSKSKEWGVTYSDFLANGITIGEIRARGEHAVADRILAVKNRSTDG